MEGKFDARCVGFEVGAHVVGFVVARTRHLFLVQITLYVDQASKAVDDRP